jgi:hypothetical protein
VRRFLLLLLVMAVCLCSFSACKWIEGIGTKSGESLLELGKDGISTITVVSYPEADDCTFSGEDINVITDHLSSLVLLTNFPENPDEMVGMSWVITISYENGASATVIYFGEFIRTENRPWYKIRYTEGKRFVELLEELAG